MWCNTNEKAPVALGGKNCNQLPEVQQTISVPLRDQARTVLSKTF